MAVTGVEAGPRRVDNNGVQRTYHLTVTPADATDHEQQIMNWVASTSPYNIPLSVAGYPQADFSAEEQEEIHGDYILTFNWGVPQNASSPQDAGTVEYSFNFQAGGGLFKQSLQTMFCYSKAGISFPGNVNMYGGGINVVLDGGKLRVEGQNLSPPTEVFKLAYRVNSIDPSYQNTLQGLCGKVNNAAYNGAQAGELMLVRVSGGRDTSGIWSLEYGFAYIKNVVNADNLTIGEIDIVQKDGMDLIWFFYGAVANEIVGHTAPKPIYALVERIYERANFSALALPGIS